MYFECLIDKAYLIWSWSSIVEVIADLSFFFWQKEKVGNIPKAPLQSILPHVFLGFVFRYANLFYKLMEFIFFFSLNDFFLFFCFPLPDYNSKILFP